MSRYLKDLHRSFKIKLQRVFFKGGDKRQLQEQFDVHKLFLFTSYHAQQQQQQSGAHTFPDDLAAELIEQAKTLSFEQQRQAVQHNLNSQLVNIARTLHTCLAQEQDRRPSATALQQTWHNLQKQQPLHHHSQSTSPAANSSHGSIADQQQQQQEQQEQQEQQQQQQHGQGQVISQARLSHLLQQQLGYSLTVRPSQIQHQDAGLGLFVEGETPPGALLALFPGLVYSRDVHRRMPGYPRMDVGNPYLTARYDSCIVDSLPWGRGWLADGQMHGNPAVAPRRLGMIGSLAAASDGPRQPVPDTLWVRATTGEAAALEMLEGRNPVAMAHYANHPAAGSVPNAVIASFTFTPPGCISSRQQQQHGGSTSNNSSSSGSSGVDGLIEPWMRAYVPNINYRYQCSHADLLTQEVSCVGLVSVTTLTPGTEVFFNYRLSPSLLGRPSWYVPVDSKEENMRWA